VTLDASYYKDNQRNKVHAGDECYPGPIERWSKPGGVNCARPFANGHGITCGPYEQSGSYAFEACGAGICASITVTVR